MIPDSLLNLNRSLAATAESAVRLQQGHCPPLSHSCVERCLLRVWTCTATPSPDGVSTTMLSQRRTSSRTTTSCCSLASLPS